MVRNMTECCCKDEACNDCIALLCPGGCIPATLTLTLTNSTCSIKNGDYTLTYNAGDKTWHGTVSCADDSTTGFTMTCAEVTKDEFNNPVYGFQMSFACSGALIETTNISCDPFHLEGTSEVFDLWGCCGDCDVMDTVDWEIN
jgi:hypothetical protein